MATIFERDLKKQLDRKELCPAYLLYGDDDGLKRMYAGNIVKLAVPEDDGFNSAYFTGECDLQDVYNSAMQFPIMSDRRIVSLSDYPFEKCTDANFNRLISLVDGLPDTAVLVLWFDTMEIDEKKSSRFKKLVAAVEGHKGVVAKLDHRTDSDLARMLVGAAQKRGCTMDSSTARHMIEVCSSDMTTLKNELEKLVAFTGEGHITSDTVNAVCVRSVEASIYDISRELIKGNLGKSVTMLDDLMFLKIKPPAILSTLSNAFVEMYIVKTGMAVSKTPNTLASEFGYKGREFVLTRAADNARRLDENKLMLCMKELLNADYKLKSTSVDGKFVLEELMVKLVYIMSEGVTIDKT